MERNSVLKSEKEKSDKLLTRTSDSEMLIMSPSFVFFLIFRSFVIQQIPSSNLFMVVVDNECFCDSIPPITMAPIEIRYILLLTNWSERDPRCKYWKISYHLKLALHDIINHYMCCSKWSQLGMYSHYFFNENSLFFFFLNSQYELSKHMWIFK